MRKHLLLLIFLFTYCSLQAQVLLKTQSEATPPTKTLTKDALSLNFIAMGDWGRNGADHQKQVAQQMGITAADVKAQFIISTGDNFYPSGVISEHDPLFKYSFEDIYTAFSLQWDWYPVLGNHDYKSNPDAQVAYSKISRRWKMPARYYAKKFPINGDLNNQVLIAFIDTNPLIPEFYKNSEYGPNVKGQDTTQQKRWLAKVLSDEDPSIRWKIVVGHHPMYTGGSRTDGYDTKAIRRSLKPVFDRYGVDVYLTGHEHSLQYIKPEGKTHHFISGAASEKTPVKLIDDAQMVASVYGFMLFSVGKDLIRVQTINDEGEIIYNTIIKK
ncbi:metallophosphoesterase [Pedobacter sp. ISL-68]|uniref:purple acid phosphatase family protein n=1 Tax=unclassified Pedobacter TaxID=2628915 RepID=UPI001BE8031C|nr:MULTISPECIES: tartrate-resistant acid phosphatase type 5 family protein [unclassified Pedobacter]MBT2561671.1 metallophosphoesterase [Pedobacter sp. ISL-64]MBT2591060.1 metallophosphoesterase [Pedobacter sp. ISL-68]